MKNWKILALVSLSEILGIYDKILLNQKTPGRILRTLAIIIHRLIFHQIVHTGENYFKILFNICCDNVHFLSDAKSAGSH